MNSGNIQQPQLNQNYHNFPSGQRTFNNTNYNGNSSVGGNYNNYGNRQNNPSWNNGNGHDQRDNGNGGYYDRRNTFNRHDGFDYRRHEHASMDGSFERNNSRSGHEFGSNGNGRVRRDSEAEWEEWERKRELDEYAGLMTPKQKGWLRNIQTMQLATENPYRDDYYYVVSIRFTMSLFLNT